MNLPLSRPVSGIGPNAVHEPLSSAVPRHVADLMRLAWPVMLSRAGILVMAFVDIAMLGRYGPGAPGVAGLGLAVFVPVLVMAIGLVSGMVPVVSHAWGAGDRAEAGRGWLRALSWGALISCIGMILVWPAGHLLVWLGYPPEIAAEAGEVVHALAPGLPAQALFVACAFYLESTERPIWTLLAMVLANVVNLVLNWIMIFGHFGWPEMGATGAALATTIARFVALVPMFWVILAQPNVRESGVREPWGSIWGPGGWRAGRMMRRLGISAGLSNGFETVSFAAMMMMAGTLGTAALDSYSFSHNLIATSFMVGLGLSIATGVRVAQAAGAGNMREAMMAGWTGVGIGFAMMGMIGVLVLLFRDHAVLAYTDVPELVSRTASLFLFTAFVFVPDTLQVVLGQAVRALGDVWVPIGAYVFSFILLMLPLGWVLTGPAGWDERGLVLAVIIGCLSATLLLGLRFRALTRGARPTGK